MYWPGKEKDSKEKFTSRSIRDVTGMAKPDPGNKIITYMLLTALMVITFTSAIAISNGFFSAGAWLVLLIVNLGILIYLLRK